VIGYQLYIGSESRRYTWKRALENETSVSVLIDQPITFFAVSAYTADGLESAPSDELAVAADLPTNGLPALESVTPPISSNQL
jgi:hypothetical protein